MNTSRTLKKSATDYNLTRGNFSQTIYGIYHAGRKCAEFDSYLRMKEFYMKNLWLTCWKYPKEKLDHLTYFRVENIYRGILPLWI